MRRGLTGVDRRGTAHRFHTTERDRAAHDAACEKMFAALQRRPEDSALAERIALAYLDLADALARRYAHRGLEMDDLVQVARLALVKAVGRYEPAPTGFVAYAVPTITGEIKRHFRDHGWTVRPPRRLQELRARLAVCREELERSGHDASEVSRLAAELGVGTADVIEAQALGYSFRPLPLDALGPYAHTDLVLDRLPESLSLRHALATLSPRDRQVVNWRYVDELTQGQIARRLGISQMQVSRILNRVLAHLRGELEPMDARAS